MGLAVGDYDNDLDLDFYFSDMGEPMSLLQNVGGRFRHATEAAGVGGGGGNIVGWGTAFFDFDNDGWLDLFLAASGYGERFQASTGSVGLRLRVQAEPVSPQLTPRGAVRGADPSVTPWRGGYLPVRMLAREGLHTWQAA